MKPVLSCLMTIAVGLSIQSRPLSAEEPIDNIVVTSWGDIAAVYGPGTFPSMSSPEMLEGMIQHWRGRGYSGVSMRTDLGQFEPFIRRNPIPDNEEMAGSSGISNPRVAALLHGVDVIMEQFDVHETGAELSQQHGFEWWAWHPHVYSDGAPETVGAPGLGRIWPWSYVYKYEYENQHVITVNRAGDKLWMVPEYGYPGLREYKVKELLHMAKTFGIKNFLLCMRSEINQLIDPPADADEFGFNEITVKDMKRLYDVDIMTDPRFDWKSPDFDRNDEMVNNWRDLRGDYLTAYFREARAALREYDPEIQLGVTLSGDHVGPPLGNWRLDWRAWVDEGLFDIIISPVFFEGTLDHDADKKGYLTNVRAGKGIVTPKEMNEYIKNSDHPDIKVINAGGNPYLFQTPPSGASGWRTDIWYSAYTLAWYQRWFEQWVPKVEKQGYISFLSQDFDDFPLGNSGRARGWGSMNYDPAKGTAEGVWYTLGDGSDARPHTVDDITRGDVGRAIKLTRAIDGQSNLLGWRNANPDRSNMVNGVDTSITNGSATFSFWVYRPDEQGGVSAYIQETGAEMDAGINVAPGSGVVSFSTGRVADHGDWVATDFAVPVGKWTRLALVLDLDAMTYGLFTGPGNETLLKHDIALEKPKERFTALNGVNIPIKVPSMKSYKLLQFVPEGQVGASTIIDDVDITWSPTLHYAKPGTNVVLEDDFEHRPNDQPIHEQKIRGDYVVWEVEGEQPGSWTVTNDTSFARGVRSVLATSDATMTARPRQTVTLANAGVVTVDLSLFVRSDKYFPFIVPDPQTRSPQRVTIALASVRGNDILAGAYVGDGRWEMLAGNERIPTTNGIAFDVWNQMQIAIDPDAGVFRIVAQPLGEVPRLVGEAPLPEDFDIRTPLHLMIKTENMGQTVSLYDNVRMVTGGEMSSP